MKTKFFRNNAFVKASALVNRFLGKLGMTVVLLCPVVLAAQNGVTVSNLNVDAGAVTLNVSWDKADAPEGKAWVFVDYNNNGVMERLQVTGAAVSAGEFEKLPGNNDGVWVINSSDADNFTSTVTLYYTSPTRAGGVCAYASTYPPVGQYESATAVIFTGTAPYSLVFNEGGGITTWQCAYTIPAGKTLKSFTDKTGAPGTFKCKTPLALPLLASAPGYCEDTPGVTFSMDGTEDGVTYQLVKDNADVVGELTGTGSAAQFSGTHQAGSYTARSKAGNYCALAMPGMLEITAYPVPDPPTISGASTACVAATFTATPGANGTGVRWDNGSSDTSLVAGSSGSYAAVSTTENGCVSPTRGLDVVVFPASNATCVALAPCPAGYVKCGHLCSPICRALRVINAPLSSGAGQYIYQQEAINFCQTIDCSKYVFNINIDQFDCDVGDCENGMQLCGNERCSFSTAICRTSHWLHYIMVHK